MVEVVFSEHLKELFGQRPPSPLRQKAWERFMELGLPRKTPVRGVYRSRHAPVPVVCPEGALPLAEAFQTYGAFLKGRWSKQLKGERDPFAALNGALHEEGLFLYVPPGEKREVELCAPRVHLFVGAGAELRVKVSPAHGEGWLSTYVDVAVEEGARVELSSEHMEYNGDFDEAYVFDHVRATLKRDSHFKALHMTDGGKGVRRDLHVQLIGEGAEADLRGGWELFGNRQAHTDVLIEHIAPHCRSSQLFKGVLHDESRSSFEGKIYVHAEAQKTDAFQLNKNLLLSDRAVASAKPNLEIFADDVKASHGATTGQCDPDELFYLRSRGLSQSQAERLLIKAFLSGVTC